MTDAKDNIRTRNRKAFQFQREIDTARTRIHIITPLVQDAHERHIDPPLCI
jgi:hypothetical protein